MIIPAGSEDSQLRLRVASKQLSQLTVRSRPLFEPRFGQKFRYSSNSWIPIE